MDEQTKYHRRRLRLQRLIALELLLIFGALGAVALCSLWAVQTLNRHIPDLAETLAGLRGAAEALEALDPAGLRDTLSEAVSEAKQSLTQAGETLSSFDLEGLDSAVQTLSRIIEPLSELVEKLR